MSIPDEAGVIHACFNPYSGNLRVIDTDADGACYPDETSLTWQADGPLTLGYDEVSAESDPLGPGAPTDWTDLGGPSVTIDVPDGGLVRISFAAEINRAVNPSGPLSNGLVTVFEATDFPSGLSTELEFPHDSETPAYGFVGPYEYQATTGTRTYVMQYQETADDGGTDSVTFQNRKLWIELVAPA